MPAISSAAHALRDALGFVVGFLGPEAAAAAAGAACRPWLCAVVCHASAFREPLARWWKAMKSMLDERTRMFEDDVPDRAREPLLETHAAMRPLLEQINFSQLMAPLYPCLLRRTQQLVDLHAWVCRQGDACLAELETKPGVADEEAPLPARRGAAAEEGQRERAWLAVQETDEARLRAEMLCSITQELQERLALGWQPRFRRWSEHTAKQLRADPALEVLVSDFQRHVEQVASLLDGFRYAGQKLLAFALPIHICLRARALRARGRRVDEDSMLLVLSDQLTQLGCNVPKPLHDELVLLGCAATAIGTPGHAALPPPATSSPAPAPPPPARRRGRRRCPAQQSVELS